MSNIMIENRNEPDHFTAYDLKDEAKPYNGVVLDNCYS